jgi:signal transduction histidine kinase
MVVPPTEVDRPVRGPQDTNTFSLDQPVLTVYLRNRKPHDGEVIAVTIRFRPQTVIGTIVPALVSQRFSESGNSSPYLANIEYSPTQIRSVGDIPVDWRVALLPWTPFEGWFDYYVKRLSALEPSRGAFEQLSVQPDGATTSGTGWSLNVSRLPGGLENDMLIARWRNAALALGFFLVLGLGFLGLYLTTRQTRQHEKQVRTFLALVSHELKTPLAVVQSLADNLARGIGTDEARAKEYGVVLREESDRLVRMVNNILGLTAIQGGVSQHELCPVNLATLVKDRLAREPDLQQKASDLTVQTLLPSDLPSVLGHPVALAAAVDNLVGNTFRHGTKGPGPHLVEFRLFAKNRWGRRGVCLSVRDNGPGFTRREGRGFRRPFRRGERASQEQTPGSGVGLSLVQTTAASLGGQLSWTSHPGRGTEFNLWLPVAVK